MQGISANRSYGGNTINVSKDPMAKLSYEMYEVVKQFLEGIIHLNWQGPNSKLAVIGGIMVNCDDDGTDMFVPLMFELRSQKGEVIEDIFDEAYGPKGSLAFP